MNRCFAFLLALLFATMTVSSACVAAPTEWLHFTLQADSGDGRIQANFRTESRDRNNNHLGAGFLPSELIGLDFPGFVAPAPARSVLP